MATAVRLLPVGARRKEARGLELLDGKEQELALPWDTDQPAALVSTAGAGMWGRHCAAAFQAPAAHRRLELCHSADLCPLLHCCHAAGGGCRAGDRLTDVAQRCSLALRLEKGALGAALHGCALLFQCACK